MHTIHIYTFKIYTFMYIDNYYLTELEKLGVKMNVFFFSGDSRNNIKLKDRILQVVN